MKNILKVTKLQLFDFKKPLFIYYFIIAFLTFVVLSIDLFVSNGTSSGNFGSATVIFIFIAGLNSFKSNFKFMQSFNVTRKTFFLGTIISFLIVSLLMAIVDVAMNNTLPYIIDYYAFYQSVFGEYSLIKDLIWSFAVYLLAINIGFFITMMYYKVNKIMKLVISLSPMILLITFGIIDGMTSSSMAKAVIDAILYCLGITSSIYIAFLTYLVSLLVFTGFNFLFLRRMTIKD